MLNILTVLLFLAVPALMIFLCVKFKALNKLGIVLLCYIVGMVIGNLGMLPHSFTTPSVTNVSVSVAEQAGDAVDVDILGADGAVVETVTLNAENGWKQTVKLPYEDADKNAISYTASNENAVLTASAGDSTLSLLQSITICLALPLVLFSLDIRKFFKVAKKGMLCMLLAGVSVVLVTMVLHLIFRTSTENSAQYAAGAVAVYTGGTVNFGSIRNAIGISNNDYIVFNTYDSVVSVIYIFFLSTIGRKFFLKVFRMRPFEQNSSASGAIDSTTIDESVYTYKEILYKKNIPGLLAAFGLSAVIFGISYALNMLVSTFNPSLGMTVMMLSITTLGIAFSFVRKIREIRKTFQLGMYIIYAFCFSVAASADFKALLNFSLPIFCYVCVTIVIGLFVHALLSKLFKIDVDTMIITSVSAVCSPPFVPAVAASLNNNAILVSGLATGVVGYAVGNYLGNAIYFLYSMI
ncbi:MAG: DUF819 family protein [Clostridia bacterium]|nr:DUF819 family protein [Clostridia bacterium]